jgi:hypothetical protein
MRFQGSHRSALAIAAGVWSDPALVKYELGCIGMIEIVSESSALSPKKQAFTARKAPDLVSLWMRGTTWAKQIPLQK